MLILSNDLHHFQIVEICEETIANDIGLICSKGYNQDHKEPYTLKISLEESEFLGKYDCKPIYGLASNTIPYFLEYIIQFNFLSIF